MDYKTSINVTDKLWEFARKASIIPLSIFTSMFHQRFTEHRFLESKLELLQQFYLQVESVAQDYKVFSGDQSTFSLKCFSLWKKNHSYRNTCKPFIHGTNGYMASSENAAISLSCE
jgi:hypothetical protein